MNQWSFASFHFKWQCITFESRASNAVDEGVAEVAKRTQPFAVFLHKVHTILVQWHDPTFSRNLAWSINNHFYAFFNSF